MYLGQHRAPIRIANRSHFGPRSKRSTVQDEAEACEQLPLCDLPSS